MPIEVIHGWNDEAREKFQEVNDLLKKAKVIKKAIEDDIVDDPDEVKEMLLETLENAIKAKHEAARALVWWYKAIEKIDRLLEYSIKMVEIEDWDLANKLIDKAIGYKEKIEEVFNVIDRMIERMGEENEDESQEILDDFDKFLKKFRQNDEKLKDE